MNKTKKCEYAAITAVLAFLLVLSCFNFTCVADQANATPPSQGSSLQVGSGGVQVKEHKITSTELAKLEGDVGVYDANQNYNKKVTIHGTGLKPPTEKEWADIAQNAYVVDSIEAVSTPQPSVDNSATVWFPPIGDQASQGSCVAFSVGYYTKTYQEAKEHSWDLSGATWQSNQPTPSYQNKIISPAFIYNLCNYGEDGGLVYSQAINLVCFVGVSSWEKMPYNLSDYTSWPSEAAWTEAPNNRGNSSGYQYMDISTTSGITNLKNWVAAGNLATVGIDGYKLQSQTFPYASLLTSQDMLTIDNYVTSISNHAATIVGYNDSMSYTESGTTHLGAFKIANSWGKGGWENIPDGFYWISYEAMRQRVSQHSPAMFYYDLNNYQPSILAKFAITHQKRSECAITVGLGTPTSQVRTKVFTNYVFGGTHPFCSNNMVLDVTEFKDYASQNNQPFFLSVYDGGTTTTGTITYFAIENAIASGTPLPTKQSQYVYVNLTYSINSPTLTLSPASGPPSGLITLNGGNFQGSYVNISYQNPLTLAWVPVTNNFALNSGNFSYSLNATDLMQNNLAGDHTAAYNNILFMVKPASGSPVNATYQEMRRGISQIGNSAATGLYGNNSDLTSTVLVQNGQSLTVAGNWFIPGTASLLWDTTSLGTAVIDGTGFFNTSVIVPVAAVGKHRLTIRDTGADTCVNLTRLPVITHDYVDLWHTSDFAINLTPEASDTQIFYRINYGPTCNVSGNGQPLITSEIGGNILEYWGTCNLYGNGDLPLPHSTLTDVKLDKTPPTGSIISSNQTSTPSVTLTLSATDATSGVSQMRFFNDGSVWSDWEPYTTSKTWTLTAGDGQKTVYVQYVDNAGLTSQYNCSITLQTPATPTPNVSPTQPPTQTTSPTGTPKPTPPIPELDILMVLVMLALLTLPLAALFKTRRK